MDWREISGWQRAKGSIAVGVEPAAIELNMSLRNRIMYLLAALASFAVLSTATTIYVVNLKFSSSVSTLAHAVEGTDDAERLRSETREATLSLKAMLKRKAAPSSDASGGSSVLLDRLQRLSQTLEECGEEELGNDLGFAARKFGESEARFLKALGEGNLELARNELTSEIEDVWSREIVSRLRASERRLREHRIRSVKQMISTAKRVGLITGLIGAIAAVLVIFGAALVRRWLFVPLQGLREATARFGESDFSYRTPVLRDDELGQMATALNKMAESVADAQRRMRESERKHRSLFENLRDAVVIVDESGYVIECHDGDTEVLGSDTDRAVGRHMLDHWPEWRDYSSNWHGVIQNVIADGGRCRINDVAIDTVAGRDDRVFVDLVIYRADYGGEHHAVLVFRDITERHQLETRLRRAETTEAIATLSGGLAHDFNNLLTSAITTLSVMKQRGDLGSNRERVETALRACWQAAGLSRRLLNFASGGQGFPQVIDLQESVELILASFDESFFEGVTVDTRLDSDAFVLIDKDQLTQVLLNLIQNARDAMPNGGKLHLSLEKTRKSNGRDDELSVPHVMFTIRDTGIGMSAETQTHLFEPFYTTKPRDGTHRGRGMGMAGVHAAVVGANGFIEIESAPNEGSTFRVFFPTASGTPEEAETSSVSEGIPSGEGTILVVDDDPMVLPVCLDVLAGWGYSVIAAESVAEGKTKFSDNIRDIQLAILDIRLSDGSGIDLAESLVRLNPKLRVVFITGYTEQSVPEHLRPHVCGMLRKPFQLESLANTLADALA